MMERENSGIARMFTREEAAAALGQRSECAFVLEAADGYYFQNGWEEYRRKAGASDHHTDLYPGGNPRVSSRPGGIPDIFYGKEVLIFKGGPGGEMSLVDEKGRHWPKFWDWIWAGWTGGR